MAADVADGATHPSSPTIRKKYVAIMMMIIVVINMRIMITRPGVNCAKVCNPKQQQNRLVLVDTWWYRVSMKRYWLIYDGTGSVEGGSGWALVVMGQ